MSPDVPVQPRPAREKKAAQVPSSNLLSLLVCYRPLASVAASTIGPHDRSDCI